MRKIFILLFGIFATILPLTASNPKSDFKQGKATRTPPQIRTEWGLTAAVHYNTTTLDSSATGLSARAGIGYGVGLHMGLRIGHFFAIQPEVNYQHANVVLKMEGVKDKTKVSTNTVDIPLLLSFRIANIVRINAGPLFTVMNNCYYDDSKGERQFFGNTRPTFGYSAGVAVALLRRYMIDVRYTGYFKPSLFNLEGREFGGKTQTVSLKIGFLF